MSIGVRFAVVASSAAVKGAVALRWDVGEAEGSASMGRARSAAKSSASKGSGAGVRDLRAQVLRAQVLGPQVLRVRG